MSSPAENCTGNFKAMLQDAASLELAGEYAKSRALLQRCRTMCDPATDSQLVRTIADGLLRLHPLWWTQLAHGELHLRRCRHSDAAFYRACYEDEVFAHRFNRRQAWRGDLGAALDENGRTPPLKSGLLMWVIETAQSGAVGLASLSSIDTMNRRAEFSIGFSGQIPNMLGAKTSLMALHFALVLMPFNKLYSYIYEDNALALHNAVRLGFVNEGLLHEHFRMGTQGYVSVHQIGLTRSQIHSSARLKMLAKKMIGQVW